MKKKVIGDILWELIPHENKYFITEKDLLDYITNLQQENERLEKQLEYLRTDEYLNQVKWERNFNETMNKELKSRIEKAVEYLKGNACYTESNIFVDDLCCDECMELLNILNGESNE